MRYLWRKDRPKVKKNNRKITTWIKVGNQFVDQENIRAVKRLGEQTKIFVMMGKDIVVNAPYEKVLALLPPKEEENQS